MCKGSAGCAVMRDYHSIKKEWRFGAQRLCLPKQCVALNVPNSPKFTRAMISQHMYYINNPLFYISQRLVIQNMLLACITLHQLYYITSSLHHLDALHHLTSEYTHRANPMYYTRCHMYYKGFTFTETVSQNRRRLRRVAS